MSHFCPARVPPEVNYSGHDSDKHQCGQSETYLECKTAGCPEMLRAITLFCVISEEDADIIHQYSISAEHDPSVFHEHCPQCS